MPTAQAIGDVAYMRAMPNFVVICPADAVEAEKATIAVAKRKGPVYIRLGRPAVKTIYDDSYKFEIGKASIVTEGNDAAIIASGIMVQESMAAAEMLRKEGINVRVINMSTIKPIDKAAILKAAKKTGMIVTCEDGLVNGLGGAVAEVLAENYPTKLMRIGLDGFAESGSYKDLYKKYGLDADGIARRAEDFCAKAK